MAQSWFHQKLQHQRTQHNIVCSSTISGSKSCTESGLSRRNVNRPSLERRPCQQLCRLSLRTRQQGFICCTADTEQATTSWSEFSRLASGEWEGSSATFDSKGRPQELPPQFVPGAYREWDMHLYDWQTQCSTLAEDGQLLRKVKRLMPTVGCEADAVAYNEEEQTTRLQPSNSEVGPICLSDGSYSIPAAFTTESSKAQAEHCFATGDEQRIRVVQVLRNLSSGWTLTEVEVHKECREGPFNGGKELAGCGGGMPSFAEKERLPESALSGRWVAAPATGQQSGELQRTESTGEVLRLPLNVWSSCSQQQGSLVLQAGCLLSDTELYASTQQYQDASLVGIRLGREEQQ